MTHLSTLRTRVVLLAATLVTGFASAFAAVGPREIEPVRAAVGDVPRLMDEALVPGLQLAIIDDGDVQVLPFGVADVRSGLPVTSETVFEAASLGKPVLAYAVLKLASDGRIDIDAPIRCYLDGLSDGRDKLSARQLLSHTAGLPNSASPGGPATLALPSKARFSYSGEGYGLLQRLVERISGKPLQDHMQVAVFEPLGMTSSSFVWRDEYVARKAFGHTHTGSSAGRNRISEAKAASSLETTAGDYARFLVAAARGTGLRPRFAREFLKAQVALEQGCVICVGRPAGNTTPNHWGLGLGLEDRGDRTFAWHWGDNQTMQAYAAMDRSADRGVVALTNSANGHSVIRHVASQILGFDPPGYDWLAAYGSYTEPDRRLLGKIVRQGVESLAPGDLTADGDTLRQVAERLLAGGQPEKAAKLSCEILSNASTSRADDRVLCAEALRKSGRFAEATQAATMALRLQPDNKKAEAALGRIRQSQIELPAARLALFAGRYASPFGPLAVTSDGRRLTAVLLDQPASEMLPLTEDTFLMEGMEVPIQFVLGDDGTVTHAIVRAGGEIKLKREQ